MGSDTERATIEMRMIVSTMPGWPDVSMLRAATRAGATAVLNLEGVAAADARASLSALLLNKPGRIGVRVHAPGDLGPLSDLVGALDVAIVAAGAGDETIHLIDRLQGSSRELLLECTTADDARPTAGRAVSGIVAKGHESGGRVGDETTFVLVQRLIAETNLPVYAHGGIGRHTIAACFAAGCYGVVLDAQLALARESTLPAAAKRALSRMGGDETVCLGTELDDRYRVYRRPGFAAVDELLRLEAELASMGAERRDRRTAWHDAIRTRINWRSVGAPLWPLGQDAALARPLSDRFRSVSGILSGLSNALAEHVDAARQSRPLDRHAPLAASHGTEFPILQGPMTRVSDTAEFADAVARAGGLPFLALALLRGPQVRSLLDRTKALLGQRSWGVGILGFVPHELREEQLRAIEEFRPPVALIAGGRPDQAAKLEQRGIPTYLHVPAPSLLKIFVDDGARRFVFEGRECGGHVGPRTSFVLWDAMVDTLIEAVAAGVPASEFHVVFAGGIHDARSAAMVAAIGAPLAKLGMRIGVLMGTAYLFTEEAVTSGAIVPAFQAEAVKCSRTVLLESGPGHATRCADTPFFDLFRQTRQQLVDRGGSLDDVRLELESLNLGRLRVAAKGIARGGDGPDQPKYVSVNEDQQRADGMYMIGQVAALRNATCRIADLHHTVAVDSTALLDSIVVPSVAADDGVTTTAVPAEIAIIGVGCLLPHASDPHTLWRNILDKHDAIGEIPPARFDSARYYDDKRGARDKIYSKWGGFLDEVAIDPLKYGIPPAAMRSIDPFQLLTLDVVHQALGDAGYGQRPFDRDRTSVILGASGGVGDLGFRYGIRAGLPMYFDGVPDEALSQLPEWTEDSFAGVLLNVAAGRVANRLDLGGLNFTVDAACASSLAAVYVGARELECGATDMVIVGGIDTVNSPFGYLCFSSAHALSPTGRCRTFDDTADGIVISEGLVALVLKRLGDAERDGDRIYAVIRGVAGSSDGRGKGLTAPRPEGQMRVLQRAYAAAGFSPATVGLVEAHGTGTVAGDTAEVTALTRVFGAAGTSPASCAIGSIKSMIGHTKSAAGVSGLLKVALSLYHKVLPPTLHVTKPNATLRETGTPFFVNTDALPWVAPSDPTQPRRAAVSSFGFGGTNFHVVLEEYDRSAPGALPDAAAVPTWPAEVAYWSSPSRQHLLATLQQLDAQLSRAPDLPLRVVAAAICRAAVASSANTTRLAIVSTSTADLRTKIAALCEAMQAGQARPAASSGVYLADGREPAGKVAFLFPGQGSQYPWMHRDVAVYFPEVRQSLELADRATCGQYGRRLSSYVYPPPAFSEEQRARQSRELTDTVVAQPTLGAVEHGLFELLRRLGVRPDMTAGHSYGEYVALSAAGAYPADVLFALSAARGRAIKEAAGDQPGTMAAVSAAPEVIARVLAATADVWIANVNSRAQTVLAGSAEGIDAAIAALSAAGLAVRRLPVACAFHSPLVRAAGRVMAELLDRTEIHELAIPVFSNTLAAPYPHNPADIRTLLAEHITAPVRFAEQVEAMYRAGARIFVEVGPRTVLSGLVRETLSAHEPLVLAVDAQERHGVTQLLHVIAQLAVAGVTIDFDELARGRGIESIQLSSLAPAPPIPPHAWMVSGGRARSQDEKVSPPDAVQFSPKRNTTVTTEPVIAEGAAMQSDSPPQQSQLLVDSGGGDVMRLFQQLMSQFLQTQALVMTAYLQGAPSAADSPLPAVAPLTPRALSPTSTPSTHVAVAPAPATVTTVAARAVASRKIAAEPSPVAVASPGLAPALVSAAPPAHAATARPDVLSQLLSIVSERTGYPQDMLDADANIEADLGIDSIKRMEILTAFQQVHGGAERGVLQGAMERLTAVKTLREMALMITELLTGQAEPAVA